MASVNTLCKSVLNVKNTVIKNCNLYSDKNGVKHIRIQARPNKWHENDCPFCHKSCPVYDKHSSRPTIWRGLDWGGILVEVEYQTHRIICLEHGVYVAEVPWAYPGSRFTKDFDLTVAWFASYLPRSTTSYFMRVDWETVGRCVNRALHDLEPERSRRLDGLVNIGIDETSYKKGHKYITVIVNHDTNTVVWASEGYGKSVLEKFYKQLPPEHLSEKQQLRVNLIASQNPRLYRAYLLKEQLRLLLKLTNVDEAEDKIKRWLWKVSQSRIPAFKELYQKVRHHKTHILNTIRDGMSNARIEATNNKIKLIICKVYGFRNIQNMLDMVYLVCSDICIPLPNRKLNAA